eukprot:366232-Chlamydomonas_euryale.AAC.5
MMNATILGSHVATILVHTWVSLGRTGSPQSSPEFLIAPVAPAHGQVVVADASTTRRTPPVPQPPEVATVCVDVRLHAEAAAAAGRRAGGSKKGRLL